MVLATKKHKHEYGKCNLTEGQFQKIEAGKQALDIKSPIVLGIIRTESANRGIKY